MAHNEKGSTPPPSYESLSQYPEGECPPQSSVPWTDGGLPEFGIPRAPVYNPPTPYDTSIGCGLHPGMTISICGIPRPNFKRFNVNFCVRDSKQKDMAFHFDVRLQHSDGYNQAIVRNTCLNDTWGREERDKPSFPFHADSYFEMVISVEKTCFKVTVNNQHLVDYNHRVHPSRVNHLNIDGDVRLCQIKMH